MINSRDAHHWNSVQMYLPIYIRKSEMIYTRGIKLHILGHIYLNLSEFLGKKSIVGLLD